VQNAVLLPQIVIRQHVAELPLAVAARSAYILRGLGRKTIGESVQNLLQLLAPGNVKTPVRKIVATHDGKAASAAATIIVDAMGLHLAKLRTNFLQYLPLRKRL